MIKCPICEEAVTELTINSHIDSEHSDNPARTKSTPRPATDNVASIFLPLSARRGGSFIARNDVVPPTTSAPTPAALQPAKSPKPPSSWRKRSHDEATSGVANEDPTSPTQAQAKRVKLSALQKFAPLAERMRPRTLDEVYGQKLVGPAGAIRGLVEVNKVPSMILWGDPGTGKTTIARLIANKVGSRYIEINSTSSGVGDVKKIIEEARKELLLTGRKTIIFCDEIHRFNKTQQDVFLAPVEAGEITLIGATTENPSFKINNALQSRCPTYKLDSLTISDITAILQRAIATENCDSPLLDTEMLTYIASFGNGDARTALNQLERAIDLCSRPDITATNIRASLTQTFLYDRSGDKHYDAISALHKSIRGSDPDASLYYLVRMLESGEDPLYIARRLMVVASEDVGLADNSMLSLATATHAACERIGMPECRINLAHCTVALALAPKSTRAYRALHNALGALMEPGVAALPIPLHLRNAPTGMMRGMGYGDGYKYNPDYVDGKVAQEYFPAKLKGRVFLEDVDLGSKVDEDLLVLGEDERVAMAGAMAGVGGS